MYDAISYYVYVSMNTFSINCYVTLDLFVTGSLHSSPPGEWHSSLYRNENRTASMNNEQPCCHDNTIKMASLNVVRGYFEKWDKVSINLIDAIISSAIQIHYCNLVRYNFWKRYILNLQ